MKRTLLFLFIFLVFAGCLQSDSDSDGVVDERDNCLNAPNPDQADFDGDALGDFCDPDDDGDGVLDVEDICVYDRNMNQSDLDGDGVGDACDGDKDGDSVPDIQDLCPMAPDPNQADVDKDKVGDACDLDDDGDGVLDGEDACRTVAENLNGFSDADGCPEEKPSTEVVHLSLKVTGIYCISCVWALDYKLEKTEGVIASAVHDSGNAYVAYDPSVTDEETILNIIRFSDPRSQFGVNVLDRQNCSYSEVFKSTTYCCGKVCYEYRKKS